LQQRLDLESDQLRIALLNIEKSKTDARQLESEQAALRAEAGSFKALAKAERDEAVNAERRRGLEREQHYMDECVAQTFELWHWAASTKCHTHFVLLGMQVPRQKTRISRAGRFTGARSLMSIDITSCLYRIIYRDFPHVCRLR